MYARNIEYKSKQIVEYYSTHRQSWKDYYNSEKWVLERLAEKGLGDVLDVGCACGGLGSALNQKFIVNSYTGIDINNDAIYWAIKNNDLKIPTNFLVGDIVNMDQNTCHYDTVISLSCADWNVETNRIIQACWEKVKPGGYFVISLRLTPKQSINDIKRSYQYINFFGSEKEPEKANYVIFNFFDILKLFGELDSRPELIGGYGYWGKSSPTAVVPYDKLVFTVFYIKKRENCSDSIKTELNLPLDLLI